jgi:hypothetical protein
MTEAEWLTCDQPGLFGNPFRSYDGRAGGSGGAPGGALSRC